MKESKGKSTRRKSTIHLAHFVFPFISQQAEGKCSFAFLFFEISIKKGCFWICSWSQTWVAWERTRCSCSLRFRVGCGSQRYGGLCVLFHLLLDCSVTLSALLSIICSVSGAGGRYYSILFLVVLSVLLSCLQRHGSPPTLSG